jgi:hypothetical protein
MYHNGALTCVRFLFTKKRIKDTTCTKYPGYFIQMRKTWKSHKKPEIMKKTTPGAIRIKYERRNRDPSLH